MSEDTTAHLETPSWEIVCDPRDEDVRALRRELVGFNIERAKIDRSRDIAVFIHDAQHALVGGITGWQWGRCLEIGYLWVHPIARGRGYGSRLLRMIEDEAWKLGCTTIVLDTYSFQAPAFYQRHGYTVLGQVDGYPDDIHKVWLVKRREQGAVAEAQLSPLPISESQQE